MNRLLVITGDGKGKTSSALGMALRAAGHNMKVSIIQFIKNKQECGELKAIAQIPEIEILQCGLGFVPKPDDLKYRNHCIAAQRGLNIVAEKLIDSSIHMLILDEICNAIHYGLLDENMVISMLQKAHSDLIIVCTGRYAPESLLHLADTVSVIESPKHGYETGIKAQKGVEY